jgi:hypothetical protein
VKRTIHFLFSVFLMIPVLAMAQDVIVTRNFTALWDQPLHQNQGINLQIVHQFSGEKVGVAYWFTYGDDMKSAWFIGIGPVVGNRVEMMLYEAAEVGFLEPSNPDDNPVGEIGTMTMEFSTCNSGEVEFSTGIANIGSGSFPIERITDVHNTHCTGGVSDDTRRDTLMSEQRIGLMSVRQGINGSGRADFEERADRTEFSVEVEDLADGSYRILVGGIDRGEIMVALGVGETEFRSPVEDGKVLLTFDPRGEIIEVHDVQGAVLSSGDGMLNGGGGCTNNCGGGPGGGPDLDFGTVDIEVELNNPGVYAAASGDAKLEPRVDRADFSVEIEDVPVGSYDLRIGGNVVGTIEVVTMPDGSVEGELEFRNPVEPGKQLLDFDPRGQQIDVLEGTTVILEQLFPSS